jgi:hypothetical protein
MELDELRAKWAEHDRKLETSIRLNRQLLRDNYTGRARFALRRLAALLGLGSISLLAVIVSLGAFIRNNFGMPRFVLPAVLLDILAIAALGTLNFQIGLALQIDYDQPVSTIQKRIEKLKRVRVRYVQGICLASALTWFPMFVIVLKAFLGVDVYRTFGLRWILWNVAWGLAVVPPGIWLVWKFGNRMTDAIAGYNLGAASGFLKKLEQFEREEPPR